MLPPNENGMRDMVRVPAGTVVQIIAHFDVPVDLFGTAISLIMKIMK